MAEEKKSLEEIVTESVEEMTKKHLLKSIGLYTSLTIHEKLEFYTSFVEFSLECRDTTEMKLVYNVYEYFRELSEKTKLVKGKDCGLEAFKSYIMLSIDNKMAFWKHQVLLFPKDITGKFAFDFLMYYTEQFNSAIKWDPIQLD
jgi:hypothetical protein